MPENLQRHKLADSIKSAPAQTVSPFIFKNPEDRYKPDQRATEYRALAGVLDFSQEVWRDLHTLKYDEDENGYIRFNVIDNNDNGIFSIDNVDAIEIIFIDPEGIDTKLGSVSRIPGQAEYATATAYISADDNHGENISMSDPRWEFIVGTLVKAVHECRTQV
ncbi:MAG: hypothetical protein NVS1B10_02780 [Candidatus Saccharimonadales bacterium]